MDRPTYFKKSMRTRKQVKSAKGRAEAKVKKAVRAACVERDGYCRLGLGSVSLDCGGESEWAHLGEWKRFKTRGMAPEKRHHTSGSLMLCARHHRAYDDGHFDLEYGPDGADGDVTVRRVA